jgi:nucleoside-diphosphate-sugar epimerase
MRILVTGAAGHIGRVLMRELAEHGHSVRALDRRPAPGDPVPGVEFVYADVADPLAVMTHVADSDAVIHLAAYPTPHNVSPAELMRVNVVGTANILDSVLAHGVKRVVITSSVGALGFSFPKNPCLPDYLPVDVAHPRRPDDIYGLSKLMNEENALASSRLLDGTVIVMRPPFVVDLERFKKDGWLSRRLDWSGEHRDPALWGYVDVRDLAGAYRLAIESDLRGYHVFFPIADDVFARLTAAELAEKHLPNLVSEIPKLIGKSFYDLTPAREKLGFEAKTLWRTVLEE